MGYYINPPDQSKEEFLVKHGKPLGPADVKQFDFKSEALPVCLVDNGWMTAAGIAFDAREAGVFLHPDGRPKKWYSVSREALRPYYT